MSLLVCLAFKSLTLFMLAGALYLSYGSVQSIENFGGMGLTCPLHPLFWANVGYFSSLAFFLSSFVFAFIFIYFDDFIFFWVICMATALVVSYCCDKTP